MSRDIPAQQPVRGSLGDSLPGIDAGLLTGSKTERTQAAGKIREACLETGFFCIDNFLGHSTAHHRVLSQMQHFFNLSDKDAIKQAIDVSGQDNTYGWMPMFQEPAYQPGTIAHLESFDCGRPRRAVDESNWAPNSWPEIADFREDVRAVWDELTTIGMETLRALTEAFEFEESFLIDRCNTQDLSTMRLLHYPSHVNTDASTGAVGISAHTDFECITLISQTSPGLELMDVRGDWYDAPAQDDRLVIMPGDMFERWTNGMCRATGHRVRTRGWQRYSVVLFFGVNDEVTVTPQKQFLTAEKGSQFAAVTQRQHSEARLLEAARNREEFARK